MKHLITLPQGVGLYVAAILGSGVLFIASTVASIAGVASLISWFIVIIISFPLAYSFASLSKRYPDAGGTATFVRLSFGFHAGNLVGWFYFVCATVGQTIVSLTGAFYVSHAFGIQAYTMWLALVILLIGGATNYIGIHVSGKAALIISICLVVLLLLTIMLSIPQMKLNHFMPFNVGDWRAIGSAAAIIFWSFFGWEAICSLAPLFHKPEQNIVKSTWISALLIAFIFLSLSVVTIGTGIYGNEEMNLSPIGVMMNNVLGIGAKEITAILAFIICISTVNTFVASLGQLGYSLSKAGAFPKILVSDRTNPIAPKRVVLFVVLVAGIGIVLTEKLQIKTPIRENVCFFQTVLEAEAQEFIYTYYQQPLTLKDLATHFHMSAYHLKRTFKAETGQTPRDLLESVRINKAKEYLLSTNYTNLAICYEVGFQNPASFYHAFKRQTKQTPQQYRQIRRRKSPL